ncbi:MAG: hypothetical protein AB7E52_09220, partial [Bdellovibrionales bacterium]
MTEPMDTQEISTQTREEHLERLFALSKEGVPLLSVLGIFRPEEITVENLELLRRGVISTIKLRNNGSNRIAPLNAMHLDEIEKRLSLLIDPQPEASVEPPKVEAEPAASEPEPVAPVVEDPSATEPVVAEETAAPDFVVPEPEEVDPIIVEMPVEETPVIDVAPVENGWSDLGLSETPVATNYGQTEDYSIVPGAVTVDLGLQGMTRSDKPQVVRHDPSNVTAKIEEGDNWGSIRDKQAGYIQVTPKGQEVESQPAPEAYQAPASETPSGAEPVIEEASELANPGQDELELDELEPASPTEPTLEPLSAVEVFAAKTEEELSAMSRD